MLVNRNRFGFTIVELLIVIVVIAILAAVSIVAYNGIQQRSHASAASNALTQASRKIKVWQVDNVNTSPDCTKFYELVTGKTDSSSCTFDYNGTNYQYTAGTNGGYCATATNGSTGYRTIDGGTPANGGCSGHSVNGTQYITNLVLNPSFESNTSTWMERYNQPIVRSSDWAQSGAYSLLSYISNNAFSCIYMQNQYNVANYASVTVGETYNASAYVKMYNNASTSGIIRMEWVNASGGNVGYADANFTTEANAKRVSRTAAAPANTAYVNVWLTACGLPANGGMYIDGISLTKGSSAYNYADNYADGNSPNWIWNGSANNSSSTGPAL